MHFLLYFVFTHISSRNITSIVSLPAAGGFLCIAMINKTVWGSHAQLLSDMQVNLLQNESYLLEKSCFPAGLMAECEVFGCVCVCVWLCVCVCGCVCVCVVVCVCVCGGTQSLR